jgi:alpha-1,3-mannosyltransferase
MRIVHISNNFFPTTGGIETYIYELAKRSARDGNKVYVVTSNRSPVSGRKMKRDEIIDDINIIRVRFRKFFRYSSSFEALKVALSLRPDIIHVHGIGGLSDMIPLMKIFRKNVVVSTHGGIFHTENARFLKIIYFNVSARFSLFFADRVIAHSKYDMKNFAKIVGREKMTLSHYGIDWKKLSAVKRSSDRKTLLYVGRLAKNKRLDRILKAMKITKGDVPGIRLLLVGEDWGERAKLSRMAKQFGIENDVIFSGGVPHKDVWRFLAKSDVLLLSSEYEGFGISVIEALATGMPVVVNDLDSMHEIVKNGRNGFIVDFEDSVTAAEAITKALRMNVSPKFIRDSVKIFDWDTIYKEIEKIYGDCDV